MSRAALAVAVAAAALAGCAGAAEYKTPLTTIPQNPRWLQIQEAMTPAVNHRDQNPCSQGSQACIDAVVAEMQRRFTKLAAACDHRAPFALMYMRVTEGVKAPAAGRFGDQAYLRHLDALFARLYFRAFDAWQSGRRAQAPPAWRIAFDSATTGRTSGIGDMLLGMNAHISNDLPFALLDAGLTEAHGRSAQPDFDSVNNLLGDVQAPMIREESRMFDLAIAKATLPYLGVYGGDVANVIASWRTEAWQNGRKLIAARMPAERAAVAAKIHRAAAQRAEVIQALASNRLLGTDPKARDGHCRAAAAAS